MGKITKCEGYAGAVGLFVRERQGSSVTVYKVQPVTWQCRFFCYLFQLVNGSIFFQSEDVMTLTDHPMMNYDPEHHTKLESEPMGGYDLKTFCSVRKIGGKVHEKYRSRFQWALKTSWMTLPLRIMEDLRYSGKIRNTKIEKDPIFIIGFFRTGTTYLHLLFSKDKKLAYMSNLEGYTPNFYLSFEKMSRDLLQKSLPPTRPMDNVPLLLDEPIEEEYAVGASSRYSFYNALIWPEKFDYFCKYLSFDDCPPKDVERWKKVYHRALQKVTFKKGGRQLVLKNPPNTFKIKYLLEMYPKAKFIYTYRNPYTLYASMYKFWLKTCEIFSVQEFKEDYDKIKDGFLKLFNESLNKLAEAKHHIPPENFIEIKYEDFVENPIPFMKALYEKFELEGFEEVEPEFLAHYSSQKERYIANKWDLNDEVIRDVNANWNVYREQYGYERLEPTS